MSKTVDNFGNKRVPDPAPGVSGAVARYAAGKKSYGAGRPMPNIGPVAHPAGYSERDNKAKAKRAALIRRLKGQQTGNPMNKAVMGGTSGGGFV